MCLAFGSHRCAKIAAATSFRLIDDGVFLVCVCFLFLRGRKGEAGGEGWIVYLVRRFSLNTFQILTKKCFEKTDASCWVMFARKSHKKKNTPTPPPDIL